MKPHKRGLVPAVPAVLLLLLWHQAQLTQAQNQQCRVKADICFLIDSSGSIRDAGFDNWDTILNFASQVVGRFTVGDEDSRFGAVVFSEVAILRFGLDTYNSATDIQAALRGIPYIGSFTNHADALRKARTECFSSSGDRPDAQNIAIIITDGVPTVEIGVETQEAQNLKAQQVYIMAIGITDAIDEATLEVLASDPPGGGPKKDNSYFTSPTFAGVSDILDKLVEQTCEAAPPAVPSCDTQVDLCLIIDSSGSIRDNNPPGGIIDNWKLQLEFLANLAKAFTIGPDNTRIGAVVFSEDVFLAFTLNRYTTAQQVEQAILNLAYMGQTTNTPEALIQTRLRCFDPNTGDRPDVLNLAIIVTDGLPYPENRRAPAIAAAAALRDTDVFMIAVGVTSVIDQDFLKQMSSPPQIEGETYFTAADFSSLSSITTRVVEGTCEAFVPVCATVVDLCFIIDSSGSIRDNNPRGGQPDNWALQLEFLSNLVGAFSVGPEQTRIGAVVFSEDVLLAFTLDRYSTGPEVQSAILNLQYMGQTTNTPEALIETRNRCFDQATGDRQDVRNLAIMVTDGLPYPQSRRDPAIAEAIALRDTGVTMIPIGVTDVIDKDFLKQMSSPPQIQDENFFTATSFGALEAITKTVVEGTCKAVVTEEPVCDVQVDLCFIIDSSGSIRDNNPPGGTFDNWQLQLEFLSGLIDLFTIGPDATKVGAVVFSENVNLVFTLDTYPDAQSIASAILELAYLGQTTNTPEGLKVTREQCFNAANGDRANVQNLAIFISDGVPFPPTRRDAALAEAVALQEVASVIAIGVTSIIDKDLLRAISSSPQLEGQNFFTATDFTVLTEIRKAVGEGTCQVVSAPTCDSQVDLCLVIDSSGSIRDNNPVGGIPDNWELQMQFLSNLVRAFTIGPDATKVGAVVFSEQVILSFGLNRYDNAEDVAQALLN